MRFQAATRADSTLDGLIRPFVVTILLISALVDLPRSIVLGSVTGQAILTGIYFCLAIALVALTPTALSPVPKKTLPLFMFWLWAAASIAWTDDVRDGVQNVLVIGTMLALLVLSEISASNDPCYGAWFEKWFWRSVLIVTVLYGISVVWSGAGTNEFVAARSFGLVAVLGIGYHLARWRSGQRSGLVWAIVITLLIGVSESRLALGIAVALFPLSQFPTPRTPGALRMFVVLVIVSTASYAAFVYSDSLQQRFLSGDLSLKIGSIAINGSGRTAFWRITAQSFSEAPVVGKGAGAAEGLIDSYFVDIGHPHSDYLRVAHDYGTIGGTLWASGVIGLLVILWRSWRKADGVDLATARIKLTGLLCLIAFSLEMTMENAMVYLFVTAPLGLILGAALGVGPRTVANARR
jgi:O-antigen ligase